MQKYVDIVDLVVKGFPTSTYYLVAKLGVDTDEKELLNVWGYGVGGLEPHHPRGQPAQ